MKLRFLRPDEYAENGGAADAPLPVIVSVLEAAPAAGAELDERARRLCAAIAAACDRPAENFHLVFEPPAAGRIAFGGTVRRNGSASGR